MAFAPVHAAVTASGNVNAYPGSWVLGPGDTDIGSSTLSIGNGAPGSFSVTAGSQFSAASIRFADGVNGAATGLFDGALTKVSLTSDGNSNRLELGTWGVGDLTVSGGATLNGRANANACLLGANWCHNFVGNAAGSTASLTITGAGSNAGFLRAFVVGGLAVFRPPIENFTFGTPGGTTRGAVRVLAGGSLTTEGAQLGVAPGGSSPLGTERSFADVSIDGGGSVWHVVGGQLDGSAAFITTANHRNAWATLAITNGGTLRFDGPAGQFSGINLTQNGGRSDMLVAGPGSRVEFLSDAGAIQVGRHLGTASLALRDGAQVSGLYYVSVGRDGAFGEMSLDGADTQLLVNGTASAAANGAWTNPIVDIGRNGTGVAQVLNGARIDLRATAAFGNGPQLSLGREAASSGRLSISGVGSVVSLSAASVLAGGGAGEALNPLVRVGRDGSGELNIGAGGKLLINGQAVSTVSASRSTSLFIGGSSDSTPGGTGIANVSGVGSEIAVSGTDAYIGVGHGPQSNGQLTIQAGGVVSATNMNVGRSGGVGVLRLDGGVLNLSGQQTGNNLSGASLSIGNGAGIGVATVGNGSVVTISNMGSAGAGLNLGGSGPHPFGDGSLTVSGGSQIHINAAPGKAAMSVGRDGTGFARVRGASSIDLGDGSLYVGRLSGSDGTLIVSEGSTINAGWVGVGRNMTASGSVDGGSATFVLNNSVLNAAEIVIGTAGFLGGNGTINGHVTNYGIFSPGNSPGTMLINGAYTAGAGSRLIMEVEADGAGGYKTDQVVFGTGSLLDLSALKVEFRFLGATDPNAFNASGGFDVDTFFRLRSSSGSDSDLAHDLFSSASFSAQSDRYAFSNFSFTADGGAVFQAQAVPEPQHWAMLLVGLLVVLGLGRRRQR
jgi:hypothetical protein